MILPRLFIMLLAISAIGWTLIVLPTFWSEAAISQVAAHVTAGEAYKPEILAVLEVQLDARGSAGLRSSTLGKAAVIRLRRAEDALSNGEQPAVDARGESLGRAVDAALGDAPADPFLWLALYWLDNIRDGPKAEHQRYLRMSYALGRQEAWIAVKRNRLALANFPALPADLAEAAVSEFVGLVRSELYADAADIAAGPGLPIRAVLFDRLKDLKEADRRALARLLHDRDLDDVPVPGTEPAQLRPWRSGAEPGGPSALTLGVHFAVDAG
jgi:hypothetical protein